MDRLTSMAACGRPNLQPGRVSRDLDRRDAGKSVEAVSPFPEHSLLAVTTACLRRD